MKLLAATICLAAFAGCATDENPNGGYLDGLRPAKPSADDIRTFEPNHLINEALTTGSVDTRGTFDDGVDFGDSTAETIHSPLPLQTGCLACNKEIVVLHDPKDLTELKVIDDFGHIFCRIWINDDGSLKSTDCR